MLGKQVQRILFGILLLFTPGIAVAGPFGFSTDSAPSSAHCTPVNDSLYYHCSSAPKAHPAFEYYLIQYHSDFGVCVLAGVGKKVDTNSFGSQLKIEMDKIIDQIASKYGPPTKEVDQLMSGSIWTEPEDFMMSLIRGERNIMTIWISEKREHAFDLVGISPVAQGTGVGNLMVSYKYPNRDKCEEFIKNEEANSF